MLIVSPEVVTALLTQTFDPAVIGDWVSRVGTAAVIGGVLAYVLDTLQIKSITQTANTHIDRIKKDVFDGVFNSTIDKDIYALFRQSVLYCPIYREPFSLTLTIRYDERKIG